MPGRPFLIAEEVDNIFPELVRRDAFGMILS